MNRGAAWIFDLDGTLVRTQKEFHALAEACVLAHHGILIEPDAISERFAGVHTLEVFKILAPGCDAKALLNEKWRCVQKMAQTKTIEPIAHASQLVRRLYGDGIPLAVASASPTAWILQCLFATNLKRYISWYASADEVKRSKPAPDVLLLAARRLGIVDPMYCTAVEDGKVGVQAALAAGMRTYWLTESAEVIPGAIKIHSLAELI